MKRLHYSIMVLVALVALQAAAEKAGPADADSDGQVTKQEFCALRAKLAAKAGKEYNEAASEKLFASRDSNQDGVLTGDEIFASK